VHSHPQLCPALPARSVAARTQPHSNPSFRCSRARCAKFPSDRECRIDRNEQAAHGRKLGGPSRRGGRQRKGPCLRFRRQSTQSARSTDCPAYILTIHPWQATPPVLSFSREYLHCQCRIRRMPSSTKGEGGSALVDFSRSIVLIARPCLVAGFISATRVLRELATHNHPPAVRTDGCGIWQLI
jgi:hypothetical protein